MDNTKSSLNQNYVTSNDPITPNGSTIAVEVDPNLEDLEKELKKTEEYIAIQREKLQGLITQYHATVERLKKEIDSQKEGLLTSEEYRHKIQSQITSTGIKEEVAKMMTDPGLGKL